MRQQIMRDAVIKFFEVFVIDQHSFWQSDFDYAL
jgi:hypothetical protein